MDEVIGAIPRFVHLPNHLIDIFTLLFSNVGAKIPALQKYMQFLVRIDIFTLLFNKMDYENNFNDTRTKIEQSRKQHPIGVYHVNLSSSFVANIFFATKLTSVLHLGNLRLKLTIVSHQFGCQMSKRTKQEKGTKD